MTAVDDRNWRTWGFRGFALLLWFSKATLLSPPAVSSGAALVVAALPTLPLLTRHSELVTCGFKSLSRLFLFFLLF